MNDQLQALDQVRSTAIDLGMKFGPKVLVAVLILFAGYVAGRWAARVSGRTLERFQLDAPVRKLLQRGVRLFVVGLFAIMALQNLGVELLPLIAGLGVAGAGVALAMQGVLKDPVPLISVLRLADSQIAIGELNGAILETCRARNIVMPYPQLEVRMLPGSA